MGLSYKPVQWNPQKKRYDQFMVVVMLLYIAVFAGLTIVGNSETSLETLIIRTFGSLAIVMLHVVLCIGPLARLDRRFLPLLYNRRHLGVSIFLVAAVHGVFSIIQFHTLGNVNPVVSLFTSNMDYTSLVNFPFQVLGFLSLLILFMMAATSHDFWLSNLRPRVWKSLHMLVYLAYVMVILHVFLGAFQQETSPVLLAAVGLGMVIVISLHLVAGFKESKLDKERATGNEEWEYVCKLNEIPEDRAKMLCLENERIAIFKYDGKLSAVNNVCRHQGGPLGEGKVVDGCITCPWHGYQYLPQNGQSPPPFNEKVATYSLKLESGAVYVNPKPFEPGTEVKPIQID